MNSARRGLRVGGGRALATLAGLATIASLAGVACSSSSSPGACTLSHGGTFVVKMHLTKGSAAVCSPGGAAAGSQSVDLLVSTTGAQIEGPALPAPARGCAVVASACTDVELACNEAVEAGAAGANEGGGAGDGGACLACGAYDWILDVTSSSAVTGSAVWEDGVCAWSLAGTFAP
jgi:hypothetical protein